MNSHCFRIPLVALYHTPPSQPACAHILINIQGLSRFASSACMFFVLTLCVVQQKGVKHLGHGGRSPSVFNCLIASLIIQDCIICLFFFGNRVFVDNKHLETRKHLCPGYVKLLLEFSITIENFSL